MTDRPEEKPTRWDKTLMADHPEERPPWWDKILMTDRPEEKPTLWDKTVMADHPEERPPSWDKALMRDHPEERPTRWDKALIRDHAPWWKTTRMNQHPDERPHLLIWHHLPNSYHHLLFVCSSGSRRKSVYAVADEVVARWTLFQCDHWAGGKSRWNHPFLKTDRRARTWTWQNKGRLEGQLLGSDETNLWIWC